MSYSHYYMPDKINEKNNELINFDNNLEFKIKDFMKKFDGHKNIFVSYNKEHHEDNTSIDNLLEKKWLF